ncbi:MAG: 4-hydroxyphenylacetate 3-hydroxylase N-terminal domain-containing protein [Bacteroidales bacterium]
MSDVTPKAIWVYISHTDDAVHPVSFELLGKACELAPQAGAVVEAVVIGHRNDAVIEQIRTAGAARIRSVDDARLASFSSVLFARVLADLAARERPEILLSGCDTRTAAVASRVAARLGTGLSAHCTDLKIARGLLVQTVPGFGGHIMANITCPTTRPQIATVTAGVFHRASTMSPPADLVDETMTIPGDVRVARLIDVQKTGASDHESLATARTIVAGGYGVGSRENWTLVEELAQELSAAVGATRPPVDEGWADAGQMIGASGKIVSPDLYVAVGISGMMHHSVGIRGSKVIVAINSDAKAPIFGLADYGIVGDAVEVLRALLHHLRTGAGEAPAIKEPGHTRSPEAFKASLRALRPNMYKKGRLVEDPVLDPATSRTIEGHAQIFEAARDPRYQEMMTTESHLTGKRISRYLSILRSPEDQIANSKMKRLMFQLTGTCTGGRCAGWAALNAMWSTTWDIDHDLGTDYHERLTRWLVDAQERDISVAGALTDPKGLRRLGPSKQPDPDMYLHIVKRTPEGVVVRGAKVMICGTAAANEIFVMPGVRLKREDADYAVSFAIPKDTAGITIVETRHPSDDRDSEEGFDNPVIRGGITQAYLFFENVFVPRERLFMCGEYSYANEAVFRFTLPYRAAIGGCVAGQGDVMVGASVLVARANGLDEKVFRDELTQMIVNNETTFAIGLGAAVMGRQHPSGAWLPDPLLAHANKVHVATLPYETKRLAQEIAGGIAETGCMPSYKDFVDSRYGHLVQKYLKANSPAETRMRIARLVEWLTIGGGVPGCMHGGGSPDGAKMVVFSQADVAAMVDAAKRVGGISDISLNAPPGK